ncbi:hypothetical protein [Natranaeroarchaeum aerophilus]|uniref:Uncharacterized protein n=1 Tax=Natranaeroarchaeum aerophilus TaxID=2917711 RepID=A0AAE3K5J8_9EURY|nr:hypothetical protein [Natranaeroarchaeum aerophilus]MCL9814016.1 hypothetical protein [Natranaeroarchaeum aerophilus]
MPSDFTFEIYADLLDAGLEAGYEFITIREYLSSDPLPEQFLILRPDVECEFDEAPDPVRANDHATTATARGRIAVT